MTEQVSVRIRRQNPEEDGQGTFITYVVPRARTPTVLDALLYIYENVDSSLAFRYGCRNRDCGTCSLLVDGRPRLACLTKLKEGMTLEPLRGLPLLRDLAFDQRPFLGEVSRLALYIPPGWDDGPRVVLPPPEHRRLNACIECLCCMATCPDGGYGEDALAGPYTFVKLAQLHFDPRDPVDRAAQAQGLGIDRCVECQQCYCVIGIQIVRDAISPLLKNGAAVEIPGKHRRSLIHS